mgnify:CR=1 FL=1
MKEYVYVFHIHEAIGLLMFLIALLVFVYLLGESHGQQK